MRGRRGGEGEKNRMSEERALEKIRVGIRERGREGGGREK